MEVRLASSVLVSALLRRAESDGGFATVLHSGEPNAGAVMVILRERDAKQRVIERLLQPGGTYAWRDISPQNIENELEGFLKRRRRFDPDLWLIELDVASAEQFAAEMNSID